VATPAETSPVGSDLDGLPFNETWEYDSLVGMLMYLASNTRPDIAYAIHQAARYSHGTKNSHAIAVKIILRYLKGTADKLIIFKPKKSNKIDCHVDSDFAGLFGVEDGLKLICAKSRTGYVINFCDVPIIWVSKMQTQIALSTMESEYIALYQSMRYLIPIREIPKEIMLEALDKKIKPECISYSKALIDGTPSKDEINPRSEVFEDNIMVCMKFAQMPKLSPRNKHLVVPLHLYRSKGINLEIVIRSMSSA
jgi:hypothetical protein